jgi:2-polyprenyl-6-methoxyphenol hydroxylase-like FAD-dependent oxidoreductase
METCCCIVGGGPAGIMLGLLLARAGVDVVVLEKHADFLRDFRGDTIHPSTLEVMHELGLLEEFLKRPHQELKQLKGWIGEFEITLADFSRLPTRCKFLAFMPQWDFLNFLTEKARKYPAFHLRMQAQVTGLLLEQGRVCGVRAKTPEGPLEVRADLVIGADGRHSVVRELTGLKGKEFGAPMDVVWLRFSRRPEDPAQPLGRFDRGRALVMINRGDYWQCGYVIFKGTFEDIQKRGIETLRENIAEIAPFLRDRVGELRDWNDAKLLTVLVDRLLQWYRPGLLCIGDAAHAMSPVGGVGINLAIQDAVATANILAAPLKEGTISLADLRKVQRRRRFPTAVTQRMQLFIQDNVITAALSGTRITSLPLALRLVRRWPFLQRIPARWVGIGVRPEHVQTPDRL